MLVRTLLAGTLLLANVLLAHADDGAQPEVFDDRLSLQLLSEDPEIVTPVGLAVDSKDRIFVLESHTHSPPPEYEGPEGDRIKLFADQEGDGHYELVSVFAEGLQAGMNIAFSPSGVLHVVCAREVLALYDDDGDDVCDRREQLLDLKTRETYPHNCLLGLAFQPDGTLFVTRGNIGSRGYELVGTDGTSVSGYGDGGAIVRCQADGSQLEEYATGFWNAFSIKFDRNGRLLCVDNDPDARGPNRLLHIVRGGDYGYLSLYGGSGNHPFQAWSGDLPGTLPYVNGTGEAPCDLLDCLRTSFPVEYADSQLVTVWNENTIEVHDTTGRGASLAATTKILVRGGDNFRPVAIDADSKGNVYFADWMLVAYPNHGRGRIWKLSTRDGTEKLQPRGAYDEPLSSAAEEKLESVYALNFQQDAEQLKVALASDDSFVRHAAVMALAESSELTTLQTWAKDQSSHVRLGSLLAAKRQGLAREERVKLLTEFLRDSDPQVLHAAIVWAGTERLNELRPALDEMVRTVELSPILFEAYLAAVESFDPGFISGYDNRSANLSSRLVRNLEEGLLQRFAADEQMPPSVRALAIQQLPDPLAEPMIDALVDLAGNGDANLRLAAVQRVSGQDSASVRSQLLSIATDEAEDSTLRAEAVLSLSRDPSLEMMPIAVLLDAKEPCVAIEAARCLRRFRGNEQLKEIVAAKLNEVEGHSGEEALIEQLQSLVGQKSEGRPESLEAWKQTLATGGDPLSGRRVFFSAQATCSNCHTIAGRGAILGPNLSNIAQSVDRQQIIHSILRPSDQFAPEYQAWLVVTMAGKVYTGLQLDHQANGNIKMFTIEGKNEFFAAEDIDEYFVSDTSIMPNGLETTLTVSELRDLVAFLATLK